MVILAPDLYFADKSGALVCLRSSTCMSCCLYAEPAQPAEPAISSRCNLTYRFEDKSKTKGKSHTWLTVIPYFTERRGRIRGEAVA
jgi:hypothetical protein